MPINYLKESDDAVKDLLGFMNIRVGDLEQVLEILRVEFKFWHETGQGESR